MNYSLFDPSEYIRGLQQLLVSDKKKIAFLFGAGSSLAQKSADSLTIPAIGQLTDEIVNAFPIYSEYRDAIEQIKVELGSTFSIETLLSNLEKKVDILCIGELNGLTCNKMKELIIAIKMKIKEKVSIHNKIIDDSKYLSALPHIDFAKWIKQADRKYPIEVFTTNYDYMFEIAFEAVNLPYYDGFSGSLYPFFNSESVEDLSFLPTQTKLWKIHGSLGWHYNDKEEKVIRGNPDDDDILIYPSTLKYGNSKKQPYISLLDRLSNFLRQDDSVLITCGYSFNDQHINERIMTSLKFGASSHVVGFIYDKSEAHKGNPFTQNACVSRFAKENSKISMFGSRNAIIGCHEGIWKLKREPDLQDTIQVNSYYDEDAYTGDDLLKTEYKGSEKWNGLGDLILPDFYKFVSFLFNMVIE